LRGTKRVIEHNIGQRDSRADRWGELLGDFAVELIRQAHEAASAGLHLLPEECTDKEPAKVPVVKMRRRRQRAAPLDDLPPKICLGCLKERNTSRSLWCSDECFEIWIDRKAEAVA